MELGVDKRPTYLWQGMKINQPRVIPSVRQRDLLDSYLDVEDHMIMERVFSSLTFIPYHHKSHMLYPPFRCLIYPHLVPHVILCNKRGGC